MTSNPKSSNRSILQKESNCLKNKLNRSFGQSVKSCCQAVAKLIPRCCQAVAKLSSSCCQAVVKLWSRCCQAVVKLLSSCCQAVAKLIPCCCQAVAKLSSSCCQAVVKLWLRCCRDFVHASLNLNNILSSNTNKLAPGVITAKYTVNCQFFALNL